MDPNRLLSTSLPLTRRGLLLGLGAGLLRAQDLRPKVAAIITEFRHRSHADVICTRLLDGYYPNGERQEPRTRLVSMWTDQVPPDDMSRGLAHRNRFTLYPTIADALTLGGDDLAVDAVLLIGEHGEYPDNGRGQKMYPRYRLFSEIEKVFRAKGRSLPLFCDKHLSYDWSKAKAMYDAAKELKVPFLAGSSIPLTVRTPLIEIPLGAKIPRAVVAGYGGLESYGFHTIEAMQSLVERRAGGETGVASVELLEGEAVWKWREGAGAWSKPLLAAALERRPDAPPGRVEELVGEPAVYLITYRDGLEAAAFLLNGYGTGWQFAADVGGRTLSTNFGQVPETRDLPHFDGLTRCIEELFVTGKPPYPVERTLLVTGVLAAGFDSREKKAREATPYLDIRYQAPADAYFQRS